VLEDGTKGDYGSRSVSDIGVAAGGALTGLESSENWNCLIRGHVTDNDGGFTDCHTTAVVNPAAAPVVVPLQSENATLTGGTAKGSGNTGFNGIGFADFGGSGSAAQWRFNWCTAGNAKLDFRYAPTGRRR